MMPDVLPESSRNRNPPSRRVHARPQALSDNCSPSAHHHKGIIMLRSIGSVTFLALFMVGCGGGGGTSGGGTGGTSSPPPPPPINGYTVGGTVSGLVGSGLTLEVCPNSPS